MGLIEQAARRLQELKDVGVVIAPRATDDAKLSSTAPTEGLAKAGARLEVDVPRLAAAGYVTPQNPRSRIADEFRVMKRPLIANASPDRVPPLRNANLIMVTSALPGEGKSFTALNLAMSIAMEMNRTVLLVDADVVRPSLPRTLGVQPGPGLLDVLENPSIGIGSVLHRTNVEKLTFISSGTANPRATEALAGDAMTKLLAEIGTRYADRIVVFDSPPLLVTTEARILANRMGQVVFVVDAESSTQGDVTRALGTIDGAPVKFMVLNKGNPRGRPAYGYAYGYGE